MPLSRIEMKKITRRKFVKNSVMAAAAASAGHIAVSPAVAAAASPSAAPLHWLEQPGTPVRGVTWGVPWPKGTVKANSGFRLLAGNAEKPIQTWPLAYWPDGTLKWTAHALAHTEAPQGNWSIQPVQAKQQADKLLIVETGSHLKINTGKLQCMMAKNGNALFETLSAENRTVAARARLVLLVQRRAFR
jgi:hypothetical protein